MRQSVLDAAGPHAGRVEQLWWLALAIATGVYVITIGVLLWAMWRARRRERRLEEPPRDAHRRMTLGVGVGVAATVAILLLWFGADLAIGRSLRVPNDRPHLLVKVTGFQWWWKVEYPDSNPQGWITDANEIHIPVGMPVLVELTARDVIHSLWVPNLAGKKDLFPRYLDTLWFQADAPGVFRGQCAEFCGHQHAKMALNVVAHDSTEWVAWRAQAARPAPPPSDSLTIRGLEVFLAGPCVTCHRIQGTPAGATNGPDLTHLASRLSLAAGTLPNNRGNLAAWILDPQHVKPGTSMPPNALAPADLEALLAYLATLK